MDFLASLSPIRELVEVDESARIREWFAETGSLTVRYRILAKLAGVLAKVHSRALVYGDLSVENVFTSGTGDDPEVWLIDPDNLHHDISGSPIQSVYTPGYGAPEVVAGRGVSMASDVFSFAVVAHRALTLTHPYVGQTVRDGPPDLQEKAFAGELPYVNDPDEESNKQGNHGLPISSVLSERVERLFQQTFVEGRDCPEARPSLREFYHAFHEAADYTVACPSCGNSSFPRRTGSCMWCAESLPPVVIGVIGRWLPEHPIPESEESEFVMTKDSRGNRLGKVSLAAGESLRVPHRITKMRTEQDGDGGLSLKYLPDQAALRLQREDQEMYVVRMLQPDGNYNVVRVTEGDRTVPAPNGSRSQIIFGSGSTSSRCLFLKFPA
jgi:serine/threonine protein kinase